MQASPDWVQFTLDRPMIDEPGSRFVYCSPGMHLLSAILQQATKMTALDFARQSLFEPLGIRDVVWPADPQGVTHGWGDLYLHPHDMAKLGYLWLNHGQWEGRQIVSRAWVEDSVKVQMRTGGDDDYGYGWWVTGKEGEHAAIGPPLLRHDPATGGCEPHRLRLGETLSPDEGIRLSDGGLTSRLFSA
jgi:CubicO group peptidase (beta-lactamase class C family)